RARRPPDRGCRCAGAAPCVRRGADPEPPAVAAAAPVGGPSRRLRHRLLDGGIPARPGLEPAVFRWADAGCAVAGHRTPLARRVARGRLNSGKMSRSTTSPSGWTKQDLVTALRGVGITAGDTVFAHACLETLGTLRDDAPRGEVVYDALREVVGGTGTVLVPTYTFSFCRNEPFDVRRTPTAGGPWSTS